MRKSLLVATVSVFTGLAVLFRYVKNAFTAVQFINFPLAFTIIAGAYFGPFAGLLVGLLSYLLSDLLIMPGLWTLANSTLAALVGGFWGLVGGRVSGGMELFVLSYLTTFLFDVLSSMALYVAFGVGPLEAFTLGIVGLFLPVFGGSLIGVGPITEASTALLVCFLSKSVDQGWKLYGRGRDKSG